MAEIKAAANLGDKRQQSDDAATRETTKMTTLVELRPSPGSQLEGTMTASPVRRGTISPSRPIRIAKARQDTGKGSLSGEDTTHRLTMTPLRALFHLGLSARGDDESVAGPARLHRHPTETDRSPRPGEDPEKRHVRCGRQQRRRPFDPMGGRERRRFGEARPARQDLTTSPTHGKTRQNG